MRKLPGCDVLKSLYDEEQMSQEQIGAMFGATRAAVSAAMKRCMIAPRDLSNARKVGIESGRVIYQCEE